jgi:hypothetical protein
MSEETNGQGSRMPRIGETEHVPVEDKLIHLHFMLLDSHWYVAEFDGEGTFFGYVVLNGDTENAEWGYFSWEELKAVRLWGMEVELDCSWTVRRFGDILREI